MPSTLAKKSTIVRKSVGLLALRTGYAVVGRVAPEAAARRAARLFCTPFASSRTRALDAGDGGAECDTLPVDGNRLAVYRWGDPARQPYVLLAHGWSSFALRFLPWVQALRRQGYAVVAFDQPGHGFSEGRYCTLPCFARSVRAVAEAHGPAAAFVGHSLGGAASMLALADGAVAGRAILIAPAADPVAATERFARMVKLSSGLIGRVRRQLEAHTQVPMDALQAHRRAPALSQPALVVHDLEDREVPWDEGERYARHWPGARLLSTCGLGHSRIVADPGVIEAGLRFLGGETVGERVVSTPNLPFGLA